MLYNATKNTKSTYIVQYRKKKIQCFDKDLYTGDSWSYSAMAISDIAELNKLNMDEW